MFLFVTYVHIHHPSSSLSYRHSYVSGLCPKVVIANVHSRYLLNWNRLLSRPKTGVQDVPLEIREPTYVTEYFYRTKWTPEAGMIRWNITLDTIVDLKVSPTSDSSRCTGWLVQS